MHLFKWRYKVGFAETDMAGIVHFSNYFRYLENAEHAMFRSLGTSIHQPEENALRWPRVHASCDYKKPLTFEDEIEVLIFVKARTEKTVEYFMPILKTSTSPKELVAVGKFIVACCRYMPEQERIRAVPVPDPLASILQPSDPSAYSIYR